MNASSLYLREAVSSPVKWQPWSKASLALARSLKRPVLLDIGAVWCHWCHVMDQTTYADPRVANLINNEFVPIKVDSDERPDIDSYYQDAAQDFGAGGWPLTCFTTPGGAPLFIAGYMPPEVPNRKPRGYGMIYILGRVAKAYATDPSFARTAREAAAKVAAEVPRSAKRSSQEAMRVAILHSLDASYDRQNGGFGAGAPRFYDFPAIALALAHGFWGHPDFTAMALDSLRKIAAGGVYDQLGGGFHRYSADPEWRVPHFEKMGYDQAMAIEAYSLAYEESGDEDFARVARGTIGYVNATLLDPKTHTFYSHQDADAFPGDDGSYYTWTADEVNRLLKPDQARVALMYFGLDQDPSRAPDGRIVLRRAMTLDRVASRLKLSPAVAGALLSQAAGAMTTAREHRRHPKVDTVLLADRDALMVKAYLTAAAAFADDTWRRIALDDLDFIVAHMRAPDGSYCHVYSGGKASLPGLAADQVYMLDALVAAYEASSQPKYLSEAIRLADLIMAKFYDPASGLLANHDESIAGTVLAAMKSNADVLLDHPMPSVQAVAAMALEALSSLSFRSAYERDASKLLARSGEYGGGGDGTMLATLGLALENRARGQTVIAIAGGEGAGRALWQAALKTYRPAKVVIALDANASQAGKLPEAMRAMVAASAVRKQPAAFVCAGTACANPAVDPARLASLIRNFGVRRRSEGGTARAGGS